MRRYTEVRDMRTGRSRHFSVNTLFTRVRTNLLNKRICVGNEINKMHAHVKLIHFCLFGRPYKCI